MNTLINKSTISSGCLVIFLAFLFPLILANAHNCPDCGCQLHEQASCVTTYHCPSCKKEFEGDLLQQDSCLICAEHKQLVEFPCCSRSCCKACLKKLIIDNQIKCPFCRFRIQCDIDSNFGEKCPAHGCSFISHYKQGLREHLAQSGIARHEGMLFQANSLSAHETNLIIEDGIVLCPTCNDLLALTSENEPVDEYNLATNVLIPHITNNHQLHVCLLCVAAPCFTGKDKMIEHLIEKHCFNVCSVQSCDTPLTVDSACMHLYYCHREYFDFVQLVHGLMCSFAGADEPEDTSTSTAAVECSDENGMCINTPIEETGSDSSSQEYMWTTTESSSWSDEGVIPATLESNPMPYANAVVREEGSSTSVDSTDDAVMLQGSHEDHGDSTENGQAAIQMQMQDEEESLPVEAAEQVSNDYGIVTGASVQRIINLCTFCNLNHTKNSADF